MEREVISALMVCACSSQCVPRSHPTSWVPASLREGMLL